jgi:Spy/CpxP family protein refolding chaperone
LFWADGLPGQAKKDDKKEAPKAIGVSPPNWGRLELSEEQRKKVYGIHDAYKPKADDVRKKIEELEKQFAELRAKERAEQEAVLTDEQKKKLKAINSDDKKP